MNSEHVATMALAQQRLEFVQLHNPAWEHHAALAAARTPWPSRVAALLRRLRVSQPLEAAAAPARAQ